LRGGKFERADMEIHPRIIMAVTAREKEGKTHFMLDAPGPLAIFDSDYGLEGVVSKFPGKEVLVYRVPMPDPEAKDAMGSCYDTFKSIDAAYDTVLSNPSIRTVCFDTSTEIWEMVRLAYFGRVEKVKPTDYGPANGAMRRFLKKALDSDKNVIMVQKMKQEYLSNTFTGNYVMSGFGDIPHIAQVVVRPFYCTMDQELPDGQEAEAGDFGVHIVASRHNPKLNNTYYLGLMATFPMIAAMVVTGTTPAMFR